MTTTELPLIDIHVHLAGIGDGGPDAGSGPDAGGGCRVSPAKFNSVLFRLLRWQLGLYAAHQSGGFDRGYLERLRRDLAAAKGSGALDAVVLFPHEKVYTPAGEPDTVGQELYVPNEYVFACADRADLRGMFLPAMSVHPYRPEALDETARWIERGAVAMKWLPNSQGIDPRDPRCEPVYDLLAEKKVPLISHTGGEHMVKVRWPKLGNPEVLRPALERGVTVVVAHSGTRSGLFDSQWLPEFCRLAREYPHCWGDTSAFCSLGRARWIAPLLRAEGVVEKLVHGSDYPLPPAAWASLFRLGWRRMRELARVESFLERDVRIKRACGMPPAVFTNAARLLPPGSLERWGVGG